VRDLALEGGTGVKKGMHEEKKKSIPRKGNHLGKKGSEKGASTLRRARREAAFN